MKDPTRLQRKLVDLLKGRNNLKVHLQGLPWSDTAFREKFWIVQDYVNNSGDVTNEDPLQEWVEECLFFFSERG